MCVFQNNGHFDKILSRRIDMNIISSSALRNSYAEVADECRKKGEPIILTLNGKGDTVIMDIESFQRRERMLDLREKLIEIEEKRLSGEKDYSIEEIESLLKEVSDK